MLRGWLAERRMENRVRGLAYIAHGVALAGINGGESFELLYTIKVA
jgi:hypothetical protein